MARRSKPSGRKSLQRQIDTRALRQRFLIVCEGEKTEPHYFKKFHVPRKLIVQAMSTPKNTVGVVQKAIAKAQEREYDQVWCVIDRDEVPAKRFNDALALAERHDIRVAYSNQAFELWYCLHFHYRDVAAPRADYCTRLTTCLGKRYAKNAPDMYELLLDRRATAIQNAKRLRDCYNPHNPAEDDPYTTVHLLVEQLMQSEPGRKK